MTEAPVHEPFRIVAYATDGIIEGLIPYEKLTHINYSFLTPKVDGTFNHINKGWKLKLIAENAHKHDVKVLISVGGWGWDKQFEIVAADPSLRSAFVQNLKAFVDEYQLDGVDMDWEYPDAGESSQNFLALMQELRAAMPKTRFQMLLRGQNVVGYHNYPDDVLEAFVQKAAPPASSAGDWRLP